MTRTRRIAIREVLVHIGGDDRMLASLREEGLFEADELDPREADELRVAALMMAELGVNPAGVQVALHLRRRLLAIDARLGVLGRELGTRDPNDGKR
ncbi:MAG: hypothetical protein H6748_17590 [Spirochaetaceae bacterium]|nr:hypothetical protein [Myxococcales bacterium]MCB9725865.1 hypothetical protein [Spirochaetaceae bacterium]HPG24723.1 hypothetical protein [Myxococcota bacterium]